MTWCREATDGCSGPIFTLFLCGSCIAAHLFIVGGGKAAQLIVQAMLRLWRLRQMREADKGRRGKKQRGGFADDQEEADPLQGMAKGFKKRRY